MPGTATGRHRKKLLAVVIITLAVVVQVIGAVLSGSLALLADAGEAHLRITAC